MEFVEAGIVQDINETFQIATLIWNYSIEIERTGSKNTHEEILLAVSKTLKMNKKEAILFIDLMIQRKNTLLPSIIQPNNPRIGCCC